MSKIYQVKVDNNVYEVEVEFLSENEANMASVPVSTPSIAHSSPIQEVPTSAAVTGSGEPILAPMQGNIWKILKKPGEAIKKGETILILEAMKMENNIVAPKDGTIISLLVKEGDTIASGATLAELA